MWTPHIALIRKIQLHTSTIILQFNLLVFKIFGYNLRNSILRITIFGAPA